MGYHKIDDKIWDDEKFRQLSQVAGYLWHWLLGNPTSNFIGFYILRPAIAMEHIKCDNPKNFDSYLKEITRLDMALYDPENRVILLKNFLHYSPIGGEKSLKGVTNHLKKLPRTKLLYDFRDLLDQSHIKEEGRNAEIIEVVNRFLGVMNIDGMKTPPEERAGESEPMPIIPVDGLVEIWNQICGSLLPQVLSITNRRLNTIKARLKERPDLEEWKGIFQRIISSPFLRGENDRSWRADFDWCLKPDNLAKILEGKYDDRKNPNKIPTGMDAVKAMAEESLPRNQLGGNDDEGQLPQGDSSSPEIF
jgi:hypothetical protein